MEKTIHLNKIQIDITLIPGFGLAIAYEKRYKELTFILGCFLVAFQYVKPKNKKRK
jgi:hypothetical protein